METGTQIQRAQQQISIQEVGTQDPAVVDEVRALFRQYGDFLETALGREHVCFEGLEREIRELPGENTPPNGALLLARVDDQAAGCLALRRITLLDGSSSSEIRRVWAAPAFRGLGIGRLLLSEGIKAARRLGYSTVHLDTVPSKMAHAGRLYQELGFVECARYNKNPAPGVAFFRLDLT